MIRPLFAASALVLALALPAAAGSPPVDSKLNPDGVAASCAALGDKGEAIANGCRNTETGAALACDANGQCKDYFADPRYAKIKAILDANRLPRQE